jgi:hypothetical protein
VWWMISNAAALRARRIAAPASSFRMKHSSPPMIFSPMQTASEKRLAIERGSRPCSVARHRIHDRQMHLVCGMLNTRPKTHAQEKEMRRYLEGSAERARRSA